jgi:hypothetical protein
MSRKYDKKSRRWLTDEEYQRKYKKREACKGGREHDWVKVLPFGLEALPHYKGDAEVYYEYEKRIDDFEEEMNKELEEKHGIRRRYSRGISGLRLARREYICAVCKKHKYESFKV